MGSKGKSAKKNGGMAPAAVESASPSDAARTASFFSSRFSSPLVMLMAFFALRFSALIASNEPTVTTEAGAPLVQRRDRLFPPVLVDDLLRAVYAHDAAGEVVATAAARGFALEMNSVGATQLLPTAESGFGFLAPFLDAVRAPGANAFVLSAHIAPSIALPLPSIPDEADRIAVAPGATLAADAAVEPAPSCEPALLVHPSLRGRGGLVAHSVSLLALQVPAGSSGGVLQLWRATNETATPLGAPDESIALLTNQLVTFRGDARHQITAVLAKATPAGATAAPRVGGEGSLVVLVLEQYHADPIAYETLKPLLAVKGFEDESRRFIKQSLHAVAQIVGKISTVVTYFAMGAGLVAVIGGLV
jgi:hypothetical protein